MIYFIVIIAIFFIIRFLFQYKSTNNPIKKDSNVFNSSENQIQDADFEELD